MELGQRARRDAIALKSTIDAVAVLERRFGVPFDAATASRNSSDPMVRALFQREAVAAFLVDLAAATAPNQPSPPPSEIAAAMTVAQLRDLIAESEPEELDRLEAAEQAGENRKGVFTAIEKRREAFADRDAAEVEAEADAEEVAEDAADPVVADAAAATVTQYGSEGLNDGDVRRSPFYNS